MGAMRKKHRMDGASIGQGILFILAAVLFGAIVVSLPLQIVALLLGPVWLWIGLPVGVAYGVRWCEIVLEREFGIDELFDQPPEAVIQWTRDLPPS